MSAPGLNQTSCFFLDPTTAIPVDRVEVPIGTSRYVLGCKGVTNLTLVWSSWAAATGATVTMNVYGAVADAPGALDDLDPATNNYWFKFTTTFPSFPSAASAGSDFFRLTDLCLTKIMVDVVVSGAVIPDFSLGARTGL